MGVSPLRDSTEQRESTWLLRSQRPGYESVLRLLALRSWQHAPNFTAFPSGQGLQDLPPHVAGKIR